MPKPLNLSLEIDRLLAAKSVQALFSIYQQSVASLGYDSVLFALMSEHVPLGLKAEHGVLTTYPYTWVRHYLEQGYDQIDPVRTMVIKRMYPFSWQELARPNQLTEQQNLMFAEAQDAGLHAGIAVPLFGPCGCIAGMGLASSIPNHAITANAMASVQALTGLFYECYWRLLGPVADGRNVLTTMLSPRESAILQWLALGYTKAEVAQKIVTSTHTIDFHARNILVKMQARNITAAVYKAVSLGLIEPY